MALPGCDLEVSVGVTMAGVGKGGVMSGNGLEAHR